MSLQRGVSHFTGIDRIKLSRNLGATGIGFKSSGNLGATGWVLLSAGNLGSAERDESLERCRLQYWNQQGAVFTRCWPHYQNQQD